MRLTLSQMMKLVVYAAVACGCAAPLFGVPAEPEGIAALVVLCTGMVALAWCALSLALVRDRRIRTLCILGYLLCACLFMLFFLAFAFYRMTARLHPEVIKKLFTPPYWPTSMVVLASIAFFVPSSAFLVVALVRNARRPTAAAGMPGMLAGAVQAARRAADPA